MVAFHDFAYENCDLEVCLIFHSQRWSFTALRSSLIDLLQHHFQVGHQVTCCLQCFPIPVILGFFGECIGWAPGFKGWMGMVNKMSTNIATETSWYSSWWCGDHHIGIVYSNICASGITMGSQQPSIENIACFLQMVSMQGGSSPVKCVCWFINNMNTKYSIV